jgi:hypothetical protein
MAESVEMHLELGRGAEDAFKQALEGSGFHFNELEVDLELYGVSI